MEREDLPPKKEKIYIVYEHTAEGTEQFVYKGHIPKKRRLFKLPNDTPLQKGVCKFHNFFGH